jgi:hypothetical protein
VVRGVTLAGSTRVVRDSAGGLTIHDIAGDGRWLVTRDDIYRDVFGRGPDSRGEVPLAFLDYTQPNDVTPDGRTLLMTEENGIFGDFYTVCIRGTNGSPVVRIGEGLGGNFSPDGKWATGVVPRSPNELYLYPTGAGQAQKLSLGAVKQVDSALWFRDGKNILVCGTEPGHGSRCYAHDLTGTPRPVTPENTTDGVPSPDGKSAIARSSTDGKWYIFPAEGGEPRLIPSMASTDTVVRWPEAGSVIIRGALSELPARVDRVDLKTGKRSALARFAPADLTGSIASYNLTVSDDGKWYAYSVAKQNSTLFLIEPTKGPKL